MNKVNQDTLKTLLIRIPVLLITFLHTILLIRILGVEGNGVYAFLMANAYLGGVLFTFNIENSFTFFLAKHPAIRDKISGLACLILCFAAIIFSTIVLSNFSLDAFWLNILLPTGYQSFFFAVFLIFSFLFLLIQFFVNSVCRGHLNFKIFNLISIITNSVTLISLCVLFYLKTEQTLSSFIEVFFVLLVIQFINSCISLFLTYRFIGLSFDFRIRKNNLVKPFLRYSLQGFWLTFANFLNKRLDIWFIEFFRGVSNLGIYALAASLTNFMMLALQPIAQVIMPHLTQAAPEEIGDILIRFAKLTLFLSCSLSLGVFLLIDWLLPLLFGQEFISAILPIKILLLGVILISVRNTFASYASAQNRQHYITVANILGVIVTILLDIFLIPSYGIIGASIASVCSYFSSNVYLLWRVFRDINKPFYSLFLFGRSDWNYWKKEIIG